MKIDTTHRNALLSLGPPLFLAAACILSISTTLKAAPLPQESAQRSAPAARSVAEVTPKSLQEYDTNMPLIQQMLKMACSNQQIDEARASLAYATYQKSNSLLAQVQGDIQDNLRFLSTPTENVRNEFAARAQQNQAQAQNSLRTAQDQFEYDQRQYQLGLGNISQTAYNRARANLTQARAQAQTAGQMPSENTIKQTAAARAQASMATLQRLESAAQNIAQTSSRADGCYVTASNTGSYANPHMDSDLVTAKTATEPTASTNTTASTPAR
jgi:hypothetical protein